MPTGKIQPEFVERIKGIGEWTKKNGASVYGTRGGPVTPRPWGVTTQSRDKIYVHVLDWPDELLALPDLGNVRNARLLANGQPVRVSGWPAAWCWPGRKPGAIRRLASSI